ncbi:MAG: LuxR family transcriptional regulator, partial [Candidatus Dormibacteraeota bacterium]|nr:LuxR family transcriptional regulator [Candidatus Dormibacteraeota bacterium]
KLAGARLVSLVGPGGVGKSRLGLRAATDLGRGFKDGSWLVELAEVAEPELVVFAVLAALDLPDQTGAEPTRLLLDHLRARELLLLVDNCEHLLEPAAELAGQVLRAAPRVRLIATSREPLGVPGESVVPVPPLDLHSAGPDLPLHQLAQNEAVMLFVERAEAASGSFELTAANRSAVVDICRQLDGLPLAIELAAVRTRVLTPEQILDRLADRFALLTAGGRAALPRHQTLRTTIDWSHQLLAPEERVLLRRLCVFAGRFALDDVEAVCVTEPGMEALDLVSSLVDKSLVIKEEARSAACYRLHETMREYAALKLHEAGEQGAVELRCAEHYVSACRRRAANAHRGLLAFLGWIELEIDSVRAVLRRCLAQGDAARGLDIACSVGWYWFTRATTEGAYWLDQFLPLGAGHAVVRAWALFMRGFLGVLQGDSPTAAAVLERSILAARESALDRVLSDSLTMASIAANMKGDRAAARRLLAEAEQLTPSLEDPAATLGLIQARAFNGLFEGDAATVRTVSTEGVRLSRETGDLYRLTMMLVNRGVADLTDSSLAESRPFLVEALRCAREIDDRATQAHVLEALGCLAAETGQGATAGRLLGAAETIRTGAGARRLPFMTPLVDRAQEAAIARLGVARFEAEFAAGSALSRDDAIRQALAEGTRNDAGSTETEAILGKREMEVARLVAEGLTNKEIGARLFISESTVATHVRAILNKLGFNSRAQIAGWAANPG